MEDGGRRARPQPPSRMRDNVSRSWVGTNCLGKRGAWVDAMLFFPQILSRLSITVPSWDPAPARGSRPRSPAPDASRNLTSFFPTPEERTHDPGPWASSEPCCGVCLNDGFLESKEKIGCTVKTMPV